MTDAIQIQLTPSSCFTKLYIGHHLLQSRLLNDLCGELKSRIILLADRTVSDLYGKALASQLGAELFEIPRGEKAKTREVKQRIEDQMLANGYDRNTVLLGLGGGATTDLTGFIASTYMRGLPLILIPTTVIAMVDAAIGGKTAVDTSHGKNLIGSFYNPQAIISDLTTLKTLPKKEIDNGFAEIFKMGLISDSSIFNIESREIAALETLIIKASKAKIAIVERDPLDKGLRRVLNFGHTIGHALETSTNHLLSHGEAVAIGCVIESYLSFQMGYLSEKGYGQIEEFYQSEFSIRLPSCYERNHFLKALLFDKKKSSHSVRFVLLDSIGSACFFNGEYCTAVDEQALSRALTKMEQFYG